MIYKFLDENFRIYSPTDFVDNFKFSSENAKDSFDSYLQFAIKYNLLIGYPMNIENKNSRLDGWLRLFYIHREKLYPVQRCYRKCSQCTAEFDAISVRFPDLYLGIEDMMKKGFQWGLNLPYIDKCPNCGFDEGGQGQKFLAIFYNDQIITKL